MARRGAPSRIRRLPSEQRAFVERLLREDRHTLDEMLTAIRERFPDVALSRSGLHRYKDSFAETTARMRAQADIARLVVAEYGQDPDDKAGALLAHLVTTLTTNAAFAANEEDAKVSIEEVRKLARAAKDALDARRMSFQQRRAIAQEAREAALREQREKIEALGRSGAIDPAAVKIVIREAYGIET